MEGEIFYTKSNQIWTNNFFQFSIISFLQNPQTKLQPKEHYVNPNHEVCCQSKFSSLIASPRGI